MSLPKYLGADSPGPESIDVLILPIPLEQTVSFGSGTANGPQKILEAASTQVEFYDCELNCSPCEITGIFVAPSLSPSRSGERAHEEIAEHTKHYAQENPNAFPIALGGEHSITFPFLRGLIDEGTIPKDIGVLHIDAHADLRDAYEEDRYSHASVMRRIRDDLGLKTTHVGIRAIGDDEPAYIKENNVPIFFAPFHTNQIDDIINTLPENIVISIDVDGLDPSIMPSTGTPVPGGLNWYELLTLLRLTYEKRNVFAADIVELAPIENLHAPDFLVAQLVYKMIGYKFMKKS